MMYFAYGAAPASVKTGNKDKADLPGLFVASKLHFLFRLSKGNIRY